MDIIHIINNESDYEVYMEETNIKKKQLTTKSVCKVSRIGCRPALIAIGPSSAQLQRIKIHELEMDTYSTKMK
jgi:hypothetical protein